MHCPILLVYLYEFSARRLIHPVKMLVGTLAMMVLLGTFAYVSMEGSTIHNFKRRYPVVGVLFIIFAGCFITYTLGSLLVFLLGILLPFCGKCNISLLILLILFLKQCVSQTDFWYQFSVTFVHASLRLRNIKNRIANKIEGIGLKRTPMGVFLKHLGMEEEFFS